MKYKVIVLVAMTLLLGLFYAPKASADGMTSEENSVRLNVVYAEQILYCDSSLRFKAYQNGVFFDNNGSCIDPTAAFVEGQGWSTLMDMYAGGIYKWHIDADAGKFCDFYLYHGDPDVDTHIYVWDVFFTACSVRLNQPVSDKWVMYDAELPQYNPVIGACDASVADFTGYENNCLEFAREVLPSGDVIAGTGTYINKAANILKKKFYAPSKAWLSYNRKANHMYAVVSKSPAGAKVYIQKRADSRWVTVKSGERFWEGRSFVFYTKASAGEYRILIKSVVGSTYISKTLVV